MCSQRTTSLPRRSQNCCRWLTNGSKRRGEKMVSLKTDSVNYDRSSIYCHCMIGGLVAGASQDVTVKHITHARLYVRLCGASPNDQVYTINQQHCMCEDVISRRGGASIRTPAWS